MQSRLFAVATLVLAGCQSASHPPLAQPDHVDLHRFMGNWYVIAATPTFIDREAHNAVESYRLAADGSIDTTYTFRASGFDGPEKRYTPRGFVTDTRSNATWDMQFVWPIKADYRIMHVAPDYSQTIIGRMKRDYVWIMARSPQIPDADYQRLVNLVLEQGYEGSQLRKIPQQWESAPGQPAKRP
ncbi:MAG: lipocalin family protein [Casimicrobiaceae bacterium]